MEHIIFIQATGKIGLNGLTGKYYIYISTIPELSGFLNMNKPSQMLHGAGIFTYIYPKNDPVLKENIPAPWFASGHLFQSRRIQSQKTPRLWDADGIGRAPWAEQRPDVMAISWWFHGPKKWDVVSSVGSKLGEVLGAKTNGNKYAIYGGYRCFF